VKCWTNNRGIGHHPGHNALPAKPVEICPDCEC
jgi:hypothetical protein